MREGEGDCYLLIFKIFQLNIRLVKGGKDFIKVKVKVYHIFFLTRPEKPPPPPLQAISQDTRDFIQVSNSQQSPRTVEKGTSS